MNPTTYLFCVLVFAILTKNIEENLEMENVNLSLVMEEVARIAYISQCLSHDPRTFLGHLDHVTTHADL